MLCSTGAEGHALLQRRLGSGTLQLARLFKIHKCHQPQCGLIPSELLDEISSELLDETSGGRQHQRSFGPFKDDTTHEVFLCAGLPLPS